MEFIGKGRESAEAIEDDRCLYRGLVCGDLPAAWLTAKSLMERRKAERRKAEELSYATAFNCGLCLYRLGEYEKALTELKLAEQSLGSASDFDVSDRKRLTQALSAAGKEAGLLPLDPESGKKLARYGQIRIKWLMALCLLALGRQQEASLCVRFLRQYQIELL